MRISFGRVPLHVRRDLYVPTVRMVIYDLYHSIGRTHRGAV